MEGGELMNREFLEQKGLSEELIDEILAEHERCVEELRTEFAGQLSAKEEELSELRTEHAIEKELTGLGAKNLKAVKALLDMDALKNGENSAEELARQLELIRRENGFLFSDPKVPVVTGPTAAKADKGFGFKFTGLR